MNGTTIALIVLLATAILIVIGYAYYTYISDKEAEEEELREWEQLAKARRLEHNRLRLERLDGRVSDAAYSPSRRTTVTSSSTPSTPPVEIKAARSSDDMDFTAPLVIGALAIMASNSSEASSPEPSYSVGGDVSDGGGSSGSWDTGSSSSSDSGSCCGSSE